MEKLELAKSAVIMIDMQDKLLNVMNSPEQILEQSVRMLKYSNALNVPVLATEQYRKGLGESNPQLLELLKPENVYEKIAFSAFECSDFKDALNRISARSLVIFGIEAHICVCQTALDALRAGYDVRVVADAVGSRLPSNRQLALEKMRQAGAIIESTESVLYEWLGAAGTPEFKAILPLVK